MRTTALDVELVAALDAEIEAELVAALDAALDAELEAALDAALDAEPVAPLVPIELLPRSSMAPPQQEVTSTGVARSRRTHRDK
ncbi:hypothetical protein AB0C91_22215 [Streptomyces sp. NPDC048674]|uniref:hypothetical protein n=1 Tax=Streptomyces sp. NPDC048674 TaxID=3155491 RepID=UPI0034341FB1